MNKTLKKREANIVKALMAVCEDAKLHVSGFEWLTHKVDYANFPASLEVICVFDTNASLAQAKLNHKDQYLIKSVHTHMLKIGVLLKHAKQNVRFDTEEAGASQRLL